MKHIFMILFSLTVSIANSQNKPKQKDNGKPQQQHMNKMFEDALKDENIIEQEKQEMRIIIKGIIPNSGEIQTTAPPIDFTDNKALVPKKDLVRIKRIGIKELTDADIKANAVTYYTKIMAKAPAVEKTVINSVKPILAHR